MKVDSINRTNAINAYSQHTYTDKLFNSKEIPTFAWKDLHDMKLEIIVSESSDGIVIGGKSEDGNLYFLKHELKA